MATITVCDYCGQYPWTSGAVDANYYKSKDIHIIKCDDGCDFCDVCANDPERWEYDLEPCCKKTWEARQKKN